MWAIAIGRLAVAVGVRVIKQIVLHSRQYGESEKKKE